MKQTTSYTIWKEIKKL